ncbi:hypothetical protein [Kitasatospora purpeofusca]|uniref:hypothetical protein n=1 Tax=Kitasatospora purpeofusca TaxID=67352 RepID=UPI0037F8A275
MTTSTARARTYGPRQLADRVGLAEWQRERARRIGLIPDPDPATGRWSAAVVEDLAAQADAVLAAVGDLPDVGARRAEDYLAEKLGVELASGTAAELARRGHLPIQGAYKGHPLYCGLTLQRGIARRTVLAASRAGRLHQRDDLPGLLGVRDSDVGHLIRAGLLVPAEEVASSYHRGILVPLYRQADLDRLQRSRRIDWAAVRAAGPGRRSPLAQLPTARPKTS